MRYEGIFSAACVQLRPGGYDVPVDENSNTLFCRLDCNSHKLSDTRNGAEFKVYRIFHARKSVTDGSTLHLDATFGPKLHD